MAEFIINRLISGGLITNYFCNSRCRHCLYNCGSHYPRQYIQPEFAKSVVRRILAMGCRSIHIGGGEPMLMPDVLAEVIENCVQEGIEVEYVETNASWFKDAITAKSLLEGLYRKGLRALLISISPFHNEYIPFYKVSAVMKAARHVGIRVLPWVSDFISDLTIFNPRTTHPLSEFQEHFGDDYLLQILKRYWIHFGGRALNTFRSVLPNMSAQQLLDAESETCAEQFLNTTHFHIDLFGNYIPGLCAGLSVSMDDLGKPITQTRYPILSTLFHSGVRGLYVLAAKELNYTPKRSGYIGKCDLCTEIRLLMLTHRWGDMELRPKPFYLGLE